MECKYANEVKVIDTRRSNSVLDVNKTGVKTQICRICLTDDINHEK